MKDQYSMSLFQQNSYSKNDQGHQQQIDSAIVLQQQTAVPLEQRMDQNAPLQHLNLQNNYMLHQVPFDSQSPLLRNEEKAQKP